MLLDLELDAGRPAAQSVEFDMMEAHEELLADIQGMDKLTMSNHSANNKGLTPQNINEDMLIHKRDGNVVKDVKAEEPSTGNQNKQAAQTTSGLQLQSTSKTTISKKLRHRVIISDPDVYARKCKEVTDAIHKFFVGDYHASYDALYRVAYECVLNKFGEELYSAVEAALASGVQDLGRALDAGQDDDALFLRELLDKWNQHTKSLMRTCDIVMYMDRTYVPTNKKTPIHELGVRLWRDTVIHSEKVWPRLMEAVRRLSGRSGEEAAALVPDELKSMLKELGGEVYHQVMNPPRSPKE